MSSLKTMSKTTRIISNDSVFVPPSPEQRRSLSLSLSLSHAQQRTKCCFQGKHVTLKNYERGAGVHPLRKAMFFQNCTCNSNPSG